MFPHSLRGRRLPLTNGRVGALGWIGVRQGAAPRSSLILAALSIVRVCRRCRHCSTILVCAVDALLGGTGLVKFLFYSLDLGHRIFGTSRAAFMIVGSQCSLDRGHVSSVSAHGVVVRIFCGRTLRSFVGGCESPSLGSVVLKTSLRGNYKPSGPSLIICAMRGMICSDGTK